MAFIPVPNTIEAQVRMELLGQKVENTLYFYRGSGVDEALLATLGTALIAWWEDHYATWTSASTQLNEIYLTDLTSANGPAYTAVPVGTPPVGGVGDPPLPTNCSLCVSFRTNLRGRSYRGRNYFVGLTESSVSGNQVGGTYVAGIVSAYQELFTTAASAGVVWVVASRYQNKSPRTEGNPEPITAVLCVDGFVDSQRRRLTGRGR